MKKLISTLALCCVMLLISCGGVTPTQQIDKLASLYSELNEAIEKDGATSDEAVNKYGEIMNYNMDLAADFSKYNQEERDYYAKVSREGLNNPEILKTAEVYNQRINDENFGSRPND